MVRRYTSPRIPLLTILKWQLSKRPFARSGAENSCAADTVFLDALPKGEYALWLGHASVWVGIGGVTLAIDPVLGDIPLYPRLAPLPIESEKLTADVILLTHAHYDHYDKPSVRKLLRTNPEAIVVAPQGFWRYLKGMVKRERCFEMEWWESVMVGNLFITFVPSLHWSKRTPTDTNKALWGGYVIGHGERTLYHAGDSAYGDHFSEIAERFPIDEAFLPIGAYKPETIMKHNHMNPAETVHAAAVLGAKTIIPIHYGTFRLSDEPINEPLDRQRQGNPSPSFKRMAVPSTYDTASPRESCARLCALKTYSRIGVVYPTTNPRTNSAASV